MPALLLTPELVDALCAADDAEAGRMLASRVPIRILRADVGPDFSAALVAVGTASVEVEAEFDETGKGRIRTWCADDGGRGCAHAAAALHALAERDEPFGVGGIAARSGGVATRRGVDPWERTLQGILRPAADDDGTDVALLFAVRAAERGDPPGVGVAVRPAVRGRSGAWIRSGISWDAVADVGAADRRGRVLADLHALHASRGNFPAVGARLRGGGRRGYDIGWGSPEWIRLDAVPSLGLWPLLAEAQEAGVPFVADERLQRVVPLERRPVAAALDLRTVRGRLWVEPALGGEPGERMLPLGAPTAAMARVEDGRVTALVPLERPVGEEFDRLQRTGRLSVPATRVEGFVREYLPALRAVASLVSSDGSFDVPEPALPTLVLAIRHAQPHTRLYWEWEYDDGGAHRLADAERRILDEVENAAGRFAHLVGERGRDAPFVSRDLGRDETIEFLASVLPALRSVERLRVEAHDELPRYTFATEDPHVRIGADPSGNDWFELRIVVTIQGEPVSTGELLTALSRGQTYFTLLSGTVFPLTSPLFARLRDILAEARALADETSDAVRISRHQIDLWGELSELGIVEAQRSDWFDAVRALGDARIEPRDPPPSFAAELRDYQRTGFGWLDFLRRHRLGGVLADDMGLGKTVQALAALDQARLDEPGARFLVVTPTSVVGHWLAEARRFAPELRAVAVSETAAKRGTAVADAVQDARLVVTSYAIFRLDVEQFQELGFRVAMFDEAQQIKNAASRGYACARLLDAPTKFALTGTPMENDLLELFALATLVAPGLFGTRAHFREEYQRAIERDRDRARLDRLRSRIRPFLLRRTKEKVAPELPPKTEQVREVVLHPEHRRAYERRFRREQQKLLGLLDDVNRNRVQILASLTTLRRHALDPSLAGAGGPSTKLEALGELIDEVVAEGHRVLVFSQFTEFLGLAATVAEERKVAYAYLDGSTPPRRRGAMIDRFMRGEVPVFFISLKAGGVGLNLTAADYCVLLDPWWNPAAEAQAVDRTHRIGQDRPVMVYRLIAAGTIEQKVVELQGRKRRLFEDVLGSDDAAGAAALTADDFRALLA
ncbi:DEAD/DEAH box helicase [Microbacterium sp. Marseille-Q6965]|uniref:DEAD/DEAH box helicase n=1 Tax=Microbacterium sp. Marseille-Q6965 TaxID=2965072 RepID=UPI0021B6F592|nr:DEAD/DEAH box helicase [Microbacterium sp. Marseille-Q6965]